MPQPPKSFAVGRAMRGMRIGFPAPMPLLDLPWVRAAAALAVAAALHFALWRLGRRLPLLLARWRAGRAALSPGAHLAWQRPIEIALWPVKLAVWCAAAYAVALQFPVLTGAWNGGVAMLRSAFTRPLFSVEEQRFSALDLLMLPIALVGLWLAVSLVTWLFRDRFLRSLGVERAAQDSLANLLRYALLLLGGLIVLQTWGLDARTLAIAGSVLGVGLGFGLQNIANNFVSGLLIGLERPIKIGDYVEVGKFTGTVERIGARSTVIRTNDRVSILVPNSLFLETEVINWSHGDPVSRVRLPVAVAYGTPIARLRTALLEVARRHAGVLAEPPPEVQLTAFGESALQAELLVWTRDPRGQTQLRSDLNFGIEAALRRAEIEIPFPQRVLHVQTPQIERAAELWAEREFPDAAPARRATADLPDDEPDFSERSWSDEELDGLVERMREPGGLEIRDRRHLLQHYPRCFVGRDAVRWLLEHEGLSRREALRAGALLVERGLLRHVLDEHPFADAGYFYRFAADEEAGEA